MGVTNTTNPPSPKNDRHNPRGIYKGTREEWLEEAMHIMSEWCNTVLYQPRLNRKGQVVKGSKSIAHDYSYKGRPPASFKMLPKTVKVSCSLLAEGMKCGNSLAHVQYKAFTGSGYHEIRMGAHVGGRKTKENSVRVADILLHEMVHTMFPEHGHKAGFEYTCRALGLVGKMTATYAGPALKERIEKHVVKVLGRYPHKRVNLVPRGQRKKGSRLIKCECESCGCVIRLTRKWIAQAPAKGIACPICHLIGMEVSY